jgi:hypothetical protein
LVTHDAQEPSSEGVDRHVRVVRLGHDGSDGGKGAGVGIPVAFDLVVLGEHAREIDLELDEVAVCDLDVLALVDVGRVLGRRDIDQIGLVRGQLRVAVAGGGALFDLGCIH